MKRRDQEDMGKETRILYEPKDIAQIFGFSGVRRVEQLTADGVIEAILVTVNGKRVRRYDFVPTVQKYIQYLSGKAYGRMNGTEKEMRLREQKMEADIALKESQGELHRLKTQIAAGDYISVEEVRLDYAKFFMVFKKFAMSLPARVSSMLSGLLEPIESRRIEKEMSGEINDLLNSFVVAGVVAPRDVKGILSAEARKMEEMAQEIPG